MDRRDRRRSRARGAIETENRALRLYLKGEIEENAAASAAAARESRGTEFFLSTLGCASGQLAFMARTPQWAPMAEAQRSRCEKLLAGASGPAATPR